MKHGAFFKVIKGQDTNGLYLSYGLPKQSGKYIYPLKTVESNLQKGERNRKVWKSVRYFSAE